MTDAIQEQAAMELAWRTEAKAADLKPEDRALIKRIEAVLIRRVMDGRVDGYTLATAEEIASAIVPEGWVLVPKKPTQDMLRRGAEAGLSMSVLLDDTPFACDRAVYAAMIAAAPPSREA